MTGQAVHSRASRLSVERIAALVRQGLNGQQIADRLGVRRGAIYQALARQGTSIDAIRRGEPCPSS